MPTEPAPKTPAKRKSAAIRVTLPAKIVPVCPMCAARITAKSLHFIHGIAFCADCVTDDNPTIYQVVSLMRRSDVAEHRVRHAGLAFYVPRSNEIRDLYAQRIYDLKHAPIG